MQDAPTIGIIGAGFSGTLLAVHLLRLAPPGVRILLVERDARFGRGLAFSTNNPNHLLNVRAENMSAFPDLPGHFIAWLRENTPDGGAVVEPDQPLFASRGHYGSYVQHCLTNEMQREGHAHGHFLVNDEATRLSRQPSGLILTLLGGRRHRLDLAVLAVGNLPPESPVIADASFYGTTLYRADPWDPGTLEGIAPQDPVFLIGTGLSMVDVVISLFGRGHVGPIHALSRHGLLPRRHAPVVARPPFTLEELPRSARALTRFLRERIAEAGAVGSDWRAVIDALRPISQPLWMSLPLEERSRFLRHLRAWWDVHRHRMAPRVAEQIEGAVARGQLRVLAGRIKRLEPRGAGVKVVYRPRGAHESQSLYAAAVINCAGPACDFSRIHHPLLRQMLDDGMIRPDPLALGLDLDAAGCVIDRDGRRADDLFAVGPLTKATYGEITAVPDIRSQCARLAVDLLARLAPRLRLLERRGVVLSAEPQATA